MEFSKKMQGTNLNDVACCPNGYKLVVGNNHINLLKYQSSTNIRPFAQCSANGEKFTEYSGGGYSVYRTNGGWVLQNGNNWTKHNGGEDCCPRDGGMIKFESSECTLTNENRDCSWPQGIEAEIHCA